MHHIASDGWGVAMFSNELTKIYTSHYSGTAATLPELSIQYADFATWQREWLQGPLRAWSGDCIEAALESHGGTWLDRDAVHAAWRSYCSDSPDNSFYIWQWITLGLMFRSVHA